MNKQEFLDATKGKETIFGHNRSLKAVKAKKADVVVVANNCPADLLESMGDVEVYEGTSRDLGIVCGKPYNVAVMAVMK